MVLHWEVHHGFRTQEPAGRLFATVRPTPRRYPHRLRRPLLTTGAAAAERRCRVQTRSCPFRPPCRSRRLRAVPAPRSAGQHHGGPRPPLGSRHSPVRSARSGGRAASGSAFPAAGPRPRCRARDRWWRRDRVQVRPRRRSDRAVARRGAARSQGATAPAAQLPPTAAIRPRRLAGPVRPLSASRRPSRRPRSASPRRPPARWRAARHLTSRRAPAPWVPSRPPPTPPLSSRLPPCTCGTSRAYTCTENWDGNPGNRGCGRPLGVGHRERGVAGQPSSVTGAHLRATQETHLPPVAARDSRRVCRLGRLRPATGTPAAARDRRQG